MPRCGPGRLSRYGDLTARGRAMDAAIGSLRSAADIAPLRGWR